MIKWSISEVLSTHLLLFSDRYVKKLTSYDATMEKGEKDVNEVQEIVSNLSGLAWIISLIFSLKSHVNYFMPMRTAPKLKLDCVYFVFIKSLPCFRKRHIKITLCQWVTTKRRRYYKTNLNRCMTCYWSKSFDESKTECVPKQSNCFETLIYTNIFFIVPLILSLLRFSFSNEESNFGLRCWRFGALQWWG